MPNAWITGDVEERRSRPSAKHPFPEAPGASPLRPHTRISGHERRLVILCSRLGLAHGQELRTSHAANPDQNPGAQLRPAATVLICGSIVRSCLLMRGCIPVTILRRSHLVVAERSVPRRSSSDGSASQPRRRARRMHLRSFGSSAGHRASSGRSDRSCGSRQVGSKSSGRFPQVRTVLGDSGRNVDTSSSRNVETAPDGRSSSRDLRVISHSGG